MQRKKSADKPTQNLIRVVEIRDGVAILDDGTLRSTLMVSSVNFALKSQDEQTAIIYAYQDFLNSLDFPIQISITSRKMDITPYLENIKKLEQLQVNELLQIQMDEYINFVSELVKSSNIMSKTFFITIPFAIQQSRREGPLGRFFKGLKGATRRHNVSDAEFQRNRAQLLQRINQVAIGLRGIGLRLVPLQTQELLELYYGMYNPTTSRHQRLGNAADLQVKETETLFSQPTQ